VHNTEKSATAGLDIEMPAVRFYGRKLLKAVEKELFRKNTSMKVLFASPDSIKI